MSDFIAGNLSVVNSELHNVCNVYFLIQKQYAKFFHVDSISCLFLNQWIPSAIASYAVVSIVKQCREGIPVVINYREPIISGGNSNKIKNACAYEQYVKKISPKTCANIEVNGAVYHFENQ